MEEKIEIRYKRAKFHRRVLANLMDIILLVFAFLGLFLGVRGIVELSDDYKMKMAYMDKAKLESGLYQKYPQNPKVLVDTSTMIINNKQDSSTKKKKNAIKVINEFFTYIETVANKDISSKIIKEYDEYRMQDKLVYEEIKYFTYDTAGVIIENLDCKASDEEYLLNVYIPFIDMTLQGHLITDVPNYQEYSTYLANLVMFVELPVSYCVAGLLVYLVPPLIFRRGHMTLGKKMYNIGLVDKNLLNLSTGRFLARFSMVYFLEVILSMFTFAIPMIISFTMMAFSKKRQSFPDYMLDCQEIDANSNKIYNSLDEIRVDELPGNKKPVDFKMRDLE